MALYAKLDGTCAGCNGAILKGQQIERVRDKTLTGSGIHHFAHVHCVSVANTSPAPVPAASPATRANGSGNTYRRGSIAYLITEEFLSGKNETQAFLALKEMRNSGETALIFKANDRFTHRRVPVASYQQDSKLRNAIKRQYKALRAAGTNPVGATAEPITAEPSGSPDPQPEPAIVVGNTNPDWLFGKIQEARKIADTREHDSIGYRPVNEGARMVAAGLDPMRVLNAMVIDWPDDCRAQLGVANLPALKNGECLDWLKTLAALRIPIYLKGEAGFGKSVMAKRLAVELALPYGECPMSAGASPSWLAGAWTVDTEEPFKTREFLERYQDGVFCFEEIDRADANLLTFLNNAIASEEFFNPVSGRKVTRGEKSVLIATANTWGNGATTRYPSAEMLCFSTKDRFRMGRVIVEYDAELEREIWNSAKG